MMLEQDVQAAFEGDPAAKSYHEIIFCYPGLEAVTIYRVAHELMLLGVPLVPRMMTEFAHSKTGIDIHPGARIGPGVLHRPRHRRRHRRDVRHRHQRQALPGRDAGRAVVPARRGGQHHPRHETPSDAGRRRGRLRQRHDPGRRHGDRHEARSSAPTSG